MKRYLPHPGLEISGSFFKLGYPNVDPKYYNPYYRYPQKGTPPTLGNPQVEIYTVEMGPLSFVSEFILAMAVGCP